MHWMHSSLGGFSQEPLGWENVIRSLLLSNLNFTSGTDRVVQLFADDKAHLIPDALQTMCHVTWHIRLDVRGPWEKTWSKSGSSINAHVTDTCRTVTWLIYRVTDGSQGVICHISFFFLLFSFILFFIISFWFHPCGPSQSYIDPLTVGPLCCFFHTSTEPQHLYTGLLLFLET